MRILSSTEIPQVSGGFLLAAAQAELLGFIAAGYFNVDIDYVGKGMLGLFVVNPLLVASYLTVNSYSSDLAVIAAGCTFFAHVYLGVIVVSVLYEYGSRDYLL